jgi:hypothetical protein
MAYESFTLEDVKEKLGLTVREAEGIFADVPPVAPSGWLVETLAEGAPLALAFPTEKSRSEWIIAPILLEVWRFLRLGGDVAEVDMTELYVHQIDRVLGVLLAMTA